MAKFKVGDKVKVIGKGLASKGWVGRIVKVRSGGWPYVVKFDGRDDGEYAEEEIAIANAKACNSRNPVVAKAMNACARNKAPDGWWTGKTIYAAFGWGKTAKGKVVSHKDGIIKLEDGTTFKESDAYDLMDASHVRPANACGTARNAGNTKVRVTMTTVSFQQGARLETQTMDLAKFEELIKKLGKRSMSQDIMQALASYGAADFDIGPFEVDAAML